MTFRSLGEPAGVSVELQKARFTAPSLELQTNSKGDQEVFDQWTRSCVDPGLTDPPGVDKTSTCWSRFSSSFIRKFLSL